MKELSGEMFLCDYCHEIIKDQELFILINCGHILHYDCFLQYCIKLKVCPTCKETVNHWQFRTSDCLNYENDSNVNNAEDIKNALINVKTSIIKVGKLRDVFDMRCTYSNRKITVIKEIIQKLENTIYIRQSIVPYLEKLVTDLSTECSKDIVLDKTQTGKETQLAKLKRNLSAARAQVKKLQDILHEQCTSLEKEQRDMGQFKYYINDYASEQSFLLKEFFELTKLLNLSTTLENELTEETSRKVCARKDFQNFWKKRLLISLAMSSIALNIYMMGKGK